MPLSRHTNHYNISAIRAERRVKSLSRNQRDHVCTQDRTLGKASPMVCPSCYSSDLRLSKFRNIDIGQLFLLRYPIRCRDCGYRSYGNIIKAMTLPASHRHRSSGGGATKN